MCLESQLSSSPMSSFRVVSDSVIRSEADPVGNRPILSLLFGQLSLYSKRLVARHDERLPAATIAHGRGRGKNRGRYKQRQKTPKKHKRTPQNQKTKKNKNKKKKNRKKKNLQKKKKKFFI
jgi:hypothetical protein